MAKPKPRIIESRNYDLPTYFPMLLLTGEEWRISDVKSDRLHFHNCIEIGLCETDSGIMEFMNTSAEFKAGDVTIVGSDIPHTTYSSKGTASKWSYIFININDLLGPYFSIDLIADNSLTHKLLHNFYAILSQEKYPDIHNITVELVNCLTRKELNFQFIARGLVFALFLKMINIVSEDSKSSSPSSSHDDYLVIAPALDYIREHYMNEFTVDTLADECHMSPTHFRRNFTQIMGQGPLSYLNDVRIQNADVLLRTTEMSILDISESVGFNSVSSFNRHFSELYGMPPLKWRKQTSYIRNQSVLKYTGWLVPPKE